MVKNVLYCALYISPPSQCVLFSNQRCGWGLPDSAPCSYLLQTLLWLEMVQIVFKVQRVRFVSLHTKINHIYVLTKTGPPRNEAIPEAPPSLCQTAATIAYVVCVACWVLMVRTAEVDIAKTHDLMWKAGLSKAVYDTLFWLLLLCAGPARRHTHPHTHTQRHKHTSKLSPPFTLFAQKWRSLSLAAGSSVPLRLCTVDLGQAPADSPLGLTSHTWNDFFKKLVLTSLLESRFCLFGIWTYFVLTKPMTFLLYFLNFLSF